MSETKEPITWNRILGVVLSMPGVKVDREAFLRKELKPYCSAAKLNMLGSVRPYNIVSDGIVDKVANSCIKRHTALVTTAVDGATTEMNIATATTAMATPMMDSPPNMPEATTIPVSRWFCR